VEEEGAEVGRLQTKLAMVEVALAMVEVALATAGREVVATEASGAETCVRLLGRFQYYFMPIIFVMHHLDVRLPYIFY
jgi:hypothetical protein